MTAMERRAFIKYSGHLSLTAVAAINFGCSVNPLVEEKSDRVALLYGTRYGATKETAAWIQMGIKAKVDLLDIEQISFEETVKKYDKFIIGSGIWIDGAHHRLMDFLTSQQEQIDGKVIASFIVCGTSGDDESGRKRIELYFNRFLAPLKHKPIYQKNFGGRMRINQLTEKDHAILMNFYKNVLKRTFVSWDRTQPLQAENFGVQLKKMI